MERHFSETASAKRRLPAEYRHFTLIELLIIIAIIAILAAMLLPALNRARDRAHSIKCVANLKTYTMSGLTYANDNNDYLVPADPTNVTVCIWYRNAAFRRLLGDCPGPLWFGATQVDSSNDRAGNPGLLCPALAANAVGRQGPYYSNSYGMTHEEIPVSGWNYQGLPGVAAYKLSRIIGPSQRLMFIDSADPTTDKRWSTLNYWTLNRRNVAYRHGNFTNVGLMDGHVESRGWQDVAVDHLWFGFYTANLAD